MSLSVMPGNGEMSFLVSRWIFLRALGLICLAAFISLWFQIKGLIGSSGILPVNSYLQAVQGSIGASRFWLCPTVFWFNGSDQALQVVCALGTAAALALTVGVAPIPALILIWILYLSLCVGGQDFMWFQWDVLLLETCFLAIFLAPPELWPGIGKESVVPTLARWLMWWLLFRLMFESGVVKLTSGDPNWRQLTALNYHYFTQPLPTWIGWYAQHLPAWFQRLSVVVTYIIEMGLPFLIFAGRPFRIVACVGFVFLNVLILLTGNYNFFNLLTIALSLFLLDDAVWHRLLPDVLWRAWGTGAVNHSPIGTLHVVLTVLVAVLFVGVGVLQVWSCLMPRQPTVDRLENQLNVIRSFRSLNSYGLFRVMTTSRPEIVIEGSNDGRTWKAYEFKDKPGDPHRPPRFVEPHQPRLDWQMWFAALNSFRNERWLQYLLMRLFEGKPDVIGLLRVNPFPHDPPLSPNATLRIRIHLNS